MKITADAVKLREKFYTSKTMLGQLKKGLTCAPTLIASPSKFIIEPENIGNEERSADGTLNTDNLVTKNKYILKYKMMTEAQRLVIQAELDRGITLSFQFLDEAKLVKCLSFPRELSNTNPTAIWKNVTITLKEE
jgi:hypothetical protein